MNMPARRTVVAPLAAAVLWAVLWHAVPAGQETTGRPASAASESTPAGDFSLLDHQGAFHHLYGSASDRAIVLYTNGIGCNVVAANLSKLQDLRAAYEAKGVRFFLIDSNDGETRENLQQYAQRFKIALPILLDSNQLVADQLGIDRTGVALLIDPRTRRVVFRGPVDDQTDFEVQKPSAEHRYLADAVKALLAGRPITPASTRSPGCLISKTHAASPVADAEYTTRIAPILLAKCQSCHRTGGGAPWAMTNHQTVRRWSAMIKEVLMTARMPPWHADPEIGHFQFDRSLSADDKIALVRWIDAGAPRGSGSDPLPEAPTGVEAWPLGKPDLLLEVPSIAVPATGVVPYLYETVKTALPNGVWIRDAYVQVSNTPVTHHVLVYLNAGSPTRFADNWIAGYTPGVIYRAASEDKGLRREAGTFMPAGSTVQFQIHIAPTGVAGENTVRLGLYFRDTPPAYELSSPGVGDTEFSIPPFVREHKMAAEKRIDEPVVLFGLAPHMHYRGSHAKFTAVYPDGRREELLSVPAYHFNWQTAYYFDTPKMLPAGTVIQFTGAFDNSRDNVLNPDPSQTVTFGQKTTDEMFIGYLLQGRKRAVK
jgi:peroxiredoxin